jgi:thymidine kinase
MFSEKTTALLSAVERRKYQKKTVVLFKPSIDDRYSTDSIVTHAGWSTPAVVVKDGTMLLNHLLNLESLPDAVAVDEAFMLEGVAKVLSWVYRSGIDVIVASLDISSTGKPFYEVEKMLPWATKVVKCAAVCTVCGEDAHYTYKKITNESEIFIGGADIYEPRCMRHHPHIDQRIEK